MHKFWFKPIFYNIYPLFFYSDSLVWHNVSYEADFVYVKTTLFEVAKKTIFPKFLENPSNGIDVSLAWVFGVNKDVIKVNNNKDIKFLNQDLNNIALETSRCVGQPKKYYLILEMAVLSLESRLSFIALFYPHLMVSIWEVELGESFCSA